MGRRPFLAISAAVAAAKTAGPGTRILLAGGVYTAGGATIQDLRGTATAPFWIEGPPTGLRALINTGGPGIHLVRPAYVVVRHLDINAVSQPGFNADDGGVGGNANHVVVEDLIISSLGTAAFQLTGVTDVVIRDSRAASCERAVMMVGVQRASVARFTAGSMTFAGAVITGGSRDIEVRQSRFGSTSRIGIWIGGGSDANEFRPPLSAAGNNFEAADVRVFDNLIDDADDAVTCSNCTRALVAHNEIRRISRFVFRLVQERTSVGGFAFGSPGAVRWINNAIEVGGFTGMNPGALDVFAAAGGSTALASCQLSHNLWYKTSPPATWMPNLPASLSETMGVYDRPSGYDSNGRLCAGGAVGAGLALPEVTGTLGGACRPAPPSIGPSERDPGC